MKFKQKKNTKTLSDKIADALTVKPRADIEEDQIFGTKPKILSRADFSSSESEDDTAISDFRKRNVNLLNEINKKYEGQVVSRKDVDAVSGSENSNYDSNSDCDDTNSNKKTTGFKNKSSSSEEENISNLESNEQSDDLESDDYSITKVQNQSDNESESNDNEGEGYDISQMEEPMQEDFEHLKKQNVTEEAKKGSCVRNQLLLWESFLEMRIHLQRCVNVANQMPMPDIFEELKQNESFVSESNTTKTYVTNALEKLLTLQNMLLKGFPETKNISSKSLEKDNNNKQKHSETDEEIPSDTEDEEIPSDTEEEDSADKQVEVINSNKTKKRKITDFETEIAISHKVFKSFRDSTIQKWNDKTRIATASNIKNAPTNTILQQVSYILSDKDKLVRRTQLKRTEYDIVGYKTEPLDHMEENNVNEGVLDRKEKDEYIPEIFDDNDFYHQLLRELIECKSADISDPVQLSRQWIALQQMRSKMKRKVDTKATKGRKIKYVVHKPLVNFMAPEKCTTWTEEASSELFNSLFGKLFEQNNVLNSSVVSKLKIKE